MFGVVACVAVTVCLVASGITVAYRVNYGGKIIATVKNREQFLGAVEIVKQKVNAVESKVDSVVETPEYSATLTFENKLDEEEKIADAIIENTDEIVSASSLLVDGYQVVVANADEFEQVVSDYRNSFSVEGEACTTEFIGNVDVKNGLYLADDVGKIEEVEEVVKSLDVRTVVERSEDFEIPYSTVTEKVKDQLVGWNEVSAPGENGIRRVTESVVYMNGVEIERQQVSDVVVKEPVSRVVKVGTAKSVSSANERASAYSSGFIFPLPRGCGWQVSAYYGDGRGHKGIDIRSPKGTAIYAVADGTVTLSKRNGGYGNCVIIEHANGLSTLYGHASALAVKAGTTVKAGDIIAYVGSTGNSTGNHLHFEVRKGSSNVNPAPYIGLD